MPYVGNIPAEKYASFEVQHFTTSATTTYSLTHAVANENDIRLVINNVIQQPGSGKAYTASGTTLTLSAATSGTDTMYCVFLGKAVQTVVPGQGSVGADELSANAITGQSALGAAPADTDEFLVSDSGTLKRVDYSYVKSTVVNRPNAMPLIINGSMAVAQRGTSFTSNGYTLDRWTMDESTDGAVTVTQDTDVPSGYGFANSLKIDCTTADGTIGADQYAAMVMFFEGQNLQLFKYGTSSAENLTLSFWVKAVKTGTYCIRFVKEAGSGTRYETPIEYTVSSASTWEKKVINLSPTAGSTSLITGAAGAIANNNSAGFRIGFTLAAGSNKQGTNNTWVAGSDKMGTSNQVNGLDSTSNNFWITGVQLEIGEYTSSTLPPFQHESYGDNLLRCQRYFELRGNVDNNLLANGQAVINTRGMMFLLCSPKRAIPAVTLPTSILLTAANASAGAGPSSGVTAFTNKGGRFDCNIGSTNLTVGDATGVQTSGDTTGLRFDAEL